MTKNIDSKFKIHRRYGVNLTGSPKSPLAKRSYKPGQHGPLSREKKQSNFGLQLAAKQKLRGYYGPMGERQFRRFYAKAQHSRGSDTGENLLGLLETRLDAVVYRLKWAPSIYSARQFVVHGHVYVNGRRVNIPSYSIKVGDEITLKESFRKNPVVLQGLGASYRSVPDYYAVEESFKAKFLRVPQGEEIPYPFKPDTHLIVEWYSRRI